MNTDNEIIAEFMGYTGKYCDNCGMENPPVSQRVNVNGVARLCLNCVSEKGIYSVPEHENLFAVGKITISPIPTYDTSWDWLMPVWKKFREINLGNDYAQGVFNNYLAKIAHKIAWEEIKDVHYILVLGIKWYNSHKQ
jgi:hypothetical protein